MTVNYRNATESNQQNTLMYSGGIVKLQCYYGSECFRLRVLFTRGLRDMTRRNLVQKNIDYQTSMYNLLRFTLIHS